MSGLRRLVRNTASLYAAEAVNRAGMLVLAILIARRLGSSEFGTLTYAMSVATLAAAFGDLGLTTLATKEIAADKARTPSIGIRVLILKCGFAIVSGLVLIVLASTARPEVAVLLRIYAVAVIGLAYSTSLSAILRGHELMQYEAYVRIGMAVVLTGSGSLLVLAGHGVVGVATAVAVTNFLGGGCLTAIVAHRGLLRSVSTESRWGYLTLLRRALPFAAVVILVTISFRIDVVMLGIMKPPSVVGQYSAAYRLVEVLLFVPGQYAIVLLPVLTRQFIKSNQGLERIIILSLKYFAILALPLAVFGSLLADRIIYRIYGSEFSDSVLTLRILMLVIIPTFLSAITATLISASPRPEINTYIAAGMATFNIAANLILIPHFSLFGAAVNTLATESLGLLAGLVYIAKRILIVPLARLLLKPAMAVAFSTVLVVAFPRLWLFPVYLLLYGGIFLLLGGVPREELMAFRNLVPRSAARG